LVEFTGERVVPGQVNDDLWSEHLARYAFARLYAAGKQVLDAGCGTGYGSSELASAAASVTGFDVAPEALEYARAHFNAPRFLRAGCDGMPFAASSFDLIVAFEVIEHLQDYGAFLEECARVLKQEGLLIVSSPNRSYYAETRAETGPNPYHQHEFEAEEFVGELEKHFGNVRLLLQNRVESFAFHAENGSPPAEVRIDRGGKASDAHFLIGLCSSGPLPERRSFVYLPNAANMLRERERHIHLLEEWLTKTQQERDALLTLHAALKQDLENSNRWAASLGAELDTAGQRILSLQNELETMAAGYETKVRALEDENRVKTEWALETEARYTKELEAKSAELAECVRLLEAAEQTVVERTLWAQRNEAERDQLAAKLTLVQASRWIRLGRKMGLGPAID
jgi:ubiquinone/menaquinone biosynthesis C-methylase UbiE